MIPRIPRPKLKPSDLVTVVDVDGSERRYLVVGVVGVVSDGSDASTVGVVFRMLADPEEE